MLVYVSMYVSMLVVGYDNSTLVEVIYIANHGLWITSHVFQAKEFDRSFVVHPPCTFEPQHLPAQREPCLQFV